MSLSDIGARSSEKMYEEVEIAVDSDVVDNMGSREVAKVSEIRDSEKFKH